MEYAWSKRKRWGTQVESFLAFSGPRVGTLVDRELLSLQVLKRCLIRKAPSDIVLTGFLNLKLVFAVLAFDI